MSIVEANNVSAAQIRWSRPKIQKRQSVKSELGQSCQQPARPHSRSYQQMSKQNLQSKSRSPSSSIQEDSSQRSRPIVAVLARKLLVAVSARSWSQSRQQYASQKNSVSKSSRDSGDEWQLGNSKPLPDYETLGNNASVDRDSISSDSHAARQARSMMNLRHLQINRSNDADHQNKEKSFETLADLVQYYNAFMDAKNKSLLVSSQRSSSNLPLFYYSQ
uniref:Uncharacterized protein n=1 Tax=Ditylenchus dipsaci TaxID=166011 RepID=A0A915D553_9BILA